MPTEAALLLAPKIGRDAANGLLAEVAREAATTAQPLQEILARAGHTLADLDRPEDYLGSAEEFRRRNSRFLESLLSMQMMSFRFSASG